MDEIWITDDEALILALAADPSTGGVRVHPRDSTPEVLTCWANGWIEDDGTLTELGRAVYAAVQADDERAFRRAQDAVDAAELDRLDQLCRRRPKYRRYDG